MLATISIFLFVVARLHLVQSDAKKGTPKWLQVKYFVDSHCDIGLTHTIHYPINQCVGNTRGTYSSLKLSVATNGEVTYHWAHFSDVKCTKLLPNTNGQEFIMKMRESECNKIWFKTSAGEQLWMREYLFYTKEPPSFPHPGQRYSFFQDDKCTKLVKDQVMNIDNCWKGPKNSNAPKGYRIVCSDKSLGYRIPYTDAECKNIDMSNAKPPEDAPDAPDPFHVGGPEYQEKKPEAGDATADASDGSSEELSDEPDAGSDTESESEDTSESEEITDGSRALASVSRRLLEPTTRCFPAKKRRLADTLHYVIESCYLGPEKSVVLTQAGSLEPLESSIAIADGTPDASVDWVWDVDFYSRIIDPTSRPNKNPPKAGKLRKGVPSMTPSEPPQESQEAEEEQEQGGEEVGDKTEGESDAGETEDNGTAGDTDADASSGTDTNADADASSDADASGDSGDTSADGNTDSSGTDSGAGDGTSDSSDSGTDNNADNSGDSDGAEIQPVTRKKKASKTPTMEPTSPTVSPTLSMEQILYNEELRLRQQELSETTFVMKFVFYGIIAAAILSYGYRYFLNEYMKASCGGHRDEDLEQEKKSLLRERERDELHYQKNKLHTDKKENTLASGQYNIRKLFSAIKTKSKTAGI